MKPEVHAELYRKKSRGIRVQQFYSSDFWTKEWRPEIERLQDELPKSATWRPGSTLEGFETIALRSAYAGGCEDQLKRIFMTLEKWIKEGIEAADALEQLEAKDEARHR